MKYLEVSLFENGRSIDDITGILLMNGIMDSVIEDPRLISEMMANKNSYDWDYLDEELVESIPERGCVKIYAENTGAGRAKISAALGAFGSDAPDVMIKVVDDSSWKDKYKEFFKTIDLTERLMVRPSWDRREVPDGKKVIELEPGMAFGTGGHETTALCAELLDREGCVGRTVLDIGCGSGILSIGAALLGAEKVVGIDIDEEAVTAAKRNVEKNGLSDVIEIKRGDLADGIDIKADVIAANLMAELLARFMHQAAGVMNEGAAIICSGILIEKRDIVADAMKAEGINIECEAARGDWCALLGRK